MAKRSKRPPEAPSGPFFALPHSVLDSGAWIACSPAAKALLMELCRQHNGRNNGHLHLSRTWLAPRGWGRPATVNKLRNELISMRLIIQTRHGGLNNGSHWFALTWLPIRKRGAVASRLNCCAAQLPHEQMTGWKIRHTERG